MTANAPTNTCDSFDEFFDFTLLQHDHDLQCEPCESQDDPRVLPEDVLMMDWQPTNAESFQMSVSAMTSYQQTHTHMAFDSHVTRDWPFVAPPDQLYFVGGENVDMQATFSQHPCSAASVSGSVQPNESTRGPSPSPLSSLSAREITGLPADVPARPIDVQETSLPPSGQQDNDTLTPPTLPTRQASTASLKPASAERKGPQNRIPLESRQILEDEFATNPYPCSWEMDIIAHQASLDVKRVRNWFNNTRARKKCQGIRSVTRLT
jgi:hypothetical protein